MESKIPEASAKREARRAFLARCSPKTRLLQEPVSDPYVVCGHPNPSGLGDAGRFKGALIRQSRRIAALRGG